MVAHESDADYNGYGSIPIDQYHGDEESTTTTTLLHDVGHGNGDQRWRATTAVKSNGSGASLDVAGERPHSFHDDTVGGTATIASEVINISKNLIGSGVLSLSGGIAIYTNDPKVASSTAFLFILVLGSIFGYFCVLIAKVCSLSGSRTYRECWESTVGNRGGLAVALVNALVPAQGNLALAAVLSQTLRSLLETFGLYWNNVTCLLLVTIFALVPLCLLKNLDALAPFSIFGVAGIGLVMISMVVRYFDSSYEPDGVYYNDLPSYLQPSFGNSNGSFSTLVLPFVCMIYQSWIMHYNSPRFFVELKNRSIYRYSIAVGISFGLTACVFSTIAMMGFYTFGGHANSYILNNYSPHDPLATASRLAVGFSTLMSYPVVFIGARDGFIDVFSIPDYHLTGNNLNLITILLLAVLTICSSFISDLGFINAIGGGTLATILCFVFPLIMYRHAILHQTCHSDNEVHTFGSQRREVAFALVLMIAGVVLGVMGVYEACIQAWQSKR